MDGVGGWATPRLLSVTLPCTVRPIRTGAHREAAHCTARPVVVSRIVEGGATTPMTHQLTRASLATCVYAHTTHARTHPHTG